MHGGIITNVGIEQCETFSEVICNERNQKKANILRVEVSRNVAALRNALPATYTAQQHCVALQQVRHWELTTFGSTFEQHIRRPFTFSEVC